METKFIEASQDLVTGHSNWGKFMVARFSEEEWGRQSRIDCANSLLKTTGWSAAHLLVLDLATGEGALFRVGGNAQNDLDNHQIWVCPLFESFLEWLYQQDLDNLCQLPDKIELPAAEFSFTGYRRRGSSSKQIWTLISVSALVKTFHFL